VKKRRSAKVDLYRQHASEYVTPKTPALVRTGPARYLAVSGRGEPGGAIFTAKIGLLYNMAFTIKMARKFAGRDSAVSKLEGLWWREEGDDADDRATWRWTLMIRVPPFIGAADRTKALKTLGARGKDPAVKEVTLVRLAEGLCVQMLHVGPYDREAESVAKMREVAVANGRTFSGKHHEIYLSDPRRVPAARLRTILRQPVR
jgi:hypothetical protein